MNKLWMIVGLGLAIAVAGCGGGEGENKGGGKKGGAKTEPEVSKDAKPWDPSAGKSTIEGKVVFKGEPSRRRPVDMGSDPKCAGRHPEPVLDESSIVGAGSGLANVFVRVKSGLENWTFTAPKEPARLDQVGCVYKPHVLGVQEGQPIAIRNSDEVTHNIHAFAEFNDGFNFSQATQGQEDTKVFEVSELPIKVKCDIHGWMSAYIAVVRHPFFAVTGEDGTFRFAGLPAGKYEIEAWHEIHGTQTFEVTVADGATAQVEFSFEED